MKNIALLFLAILSFNLNAQMIEPVKGYSNNIGVLVSMLDDLKSRVTRSVSDLSDSQTDFLLDKEANSIGAMILHLAAVEKYYQLFTFENRDFNPDEKIIWDSAMELGEKARANIKGKPISHYLNIWEEIRQETKRLLKTKDDKWLKSKVKKSSMNNHWAWYHVMEHQANHMGQIRLIRKRSN